MEVPPNAQSLPQGGRMRVSGFFLQRLRFFVSPLTWRDEEARRYPLGHAPPCPLTLFGAPHQRVQNV